MLLFAAAVNNSFGTAIAARPNCSSSVNAAVTIDLHLLFSRTTAVVAVAVVTVVVAVAVLFFFAVAVVVAVAVAVAVVVVVLLLLLFSSLTNGRFQ